MPGTLSFPSDAFPAYPALEIDQPEGWGRAWATKRGSIPSACAA